MRQPTALNVTIDELSLVMFRAACEACGMSEDDAWLICGEGPDQFNEIAEPIVNFINEYPEAALGVARFLLDRQKVSSLFD